MYFILGSIICFIIAFILYKSIQKNNIKMKENGILINDNETIYLSGFQELEGGQKISFNLKNDKLILTFNMLKQHMENPFKKIAIDNVIDAQILTKEQIQNAINVGKIFLFGVFAWGMPNTKTLYSNYVVIKYKDENFERDLILQSSKNQEIVQCIRELKSRKV